MFACVGGSAPGARELMLARAGRSAPRIFELTPARIGGKGRRVGPKELRAGGKSLRVLVASGEQGRCQPGDSESEPQMRNSSARPLRTMNFVQF